MKYQTACVCFWRFLRQSLLFIWFPIKTFSSFLRFSRQPTPDTYIIFSCIFLIRPTMLLHSIHFICSWLPRLFYQFVGIWSGREWDFWAVYWILLVLELESHLGFWWGFSFLFIPSPRMYRYRLLQALSSISYFPEKIFCFNLIWFYCFLCDSLCVWLLIDPLSAFFVSVLCYGFGFLLLWL